MSSASLWQRDGDVSVIADDGTVLETYSGARFGNLPLVVGEGADLAARDILALLAGAPAIRAQVKASVLVAKRRWNLHLEDGYLTCVGKGRSRRIAHGAMPPMRCRCGNGRAAMQAWSTGSSATGTRRTLTDPST